MIWDVSFRISYPGSKFSALYPGSRTQIQGSRKHWIRFRIRIRNTKVDKAKEQR
jgi:hypothetical protein